MLPDADGLKKDQFPLRDQPPDKGSLPKKPEIDASPFKI